MARDISTNFDKWDKENDSGARQFLLNSIEQSFVEDYLQPKLNSSDSFAVVWLTFVHLVVTTSSTRFDSLKSKLRSIVPQNFEGQDIDQISTAHLVCFARRVNFSLKKNSGTGFLTNKKNKRRFFYCTTLVLTNHNIIRIMPHGCCCCWSNCYEIQKLLKQADHQLTGYAEISNQTNNYSQFLSCVLDNFKEHNRVKVEEIKRLKNL